MSQCRKHRETFSMIASMVFQLVDEVADLRHDLDEARAVIGENINCGRCEPLLPERRKEPRRSAVTPMERESEREMILETLQRSRGNRTHAARDLGISLRTLRNKLAGYRLDGAL